MSEEKAIEIAEAAELVLNGYAVTRDGENFRVVNLNAGGLPILTAGTGCRAFRRRSSCAGRAPE